MKHLPDIRQTQAPPFPVRASQVFSGAVGCQVYFSVTVVCTWRVALPSKVSTVAGLVLNHD